MKALILALLVAPAFALPPITQEEALDWHTKGNCVMMKPGSGLRADGKGWISSPYPGVHIVNGKEMDMAAGGIYRISVIPPLSKIEWCVPAKIANRDSCGPVPEALLWPAVTVGNK